MASYLVMEPTSQTARAEKAVIIRDGFSVLAFLFPLFWFLWHRMWLEALAFLVIAFTLAGLATTVGSDPLVPLLSILLAILIGMEAPALRVAMLRRRDWVEWGVVEAANHGEAEVRYAAEVEQAGRVPIVPASPDSGVSPSVTSIGGRKSGRSFGLIDYPR